MENTKLRPVMMGGSCMLTTPPITTPGYGCAVLMTEDALEPSMLGATATLPPLQQQQQQQLTLMLEMEQAQYFPSVS